MRKIILASKSKARKELLKKAGLKISVAVSQAKEIKGLKGRTSDLVIENAFRKADDVAGRRKSGIVIGADTVCLAGKRIIGKPKNKKDAARTLRLLSKKPQWVYSGLVVIDIDRRVVYKTYEKTKVYMRPLKEAEILSYLRRCYALDKAGSFDIQGLGGMFVSRIEGCFSNVVGIPMAKLAQILENAGVDCFKAKK